MATTEEEQLIEYCNIPKYYPFRLTIDYKAISNSVKSTVTLSALSGKSMYDSSDTEPTITAYEARAFPKYSYYCRSDGINILSDDIETDEDGVAWVTNAEPLNSVTFDIELDELGGEEGDYTIYVFARDEYGIWTDTHRLLTADGEQIVAMVPTDGNATYAGTNNAAVYCRLAATNAPVDYRSKYTGDEIVNFLKKVLNNG